MCVCVCVCVCVCLYREREMYINFAAIGAEEVRKKKERLIMGSERMNE